MRNNDSPSKEISAIPEVYRDPIELLMEEHTEALQHVSQLRDAAERIRVEGFSFTAYGQISESIRFIDTEVRLHNEKEEEYLIPMLARHGADSPRIMRFEHRELWSSFNQLAKIVNDVADGNIHGSCILELVDASNAVAELLTNHIEKENTVLFPMAKKILTRDEYDQLGKAMNTAPHANSKKSKRCEGKS